MSATHTGTREHMAVLNERYDLSNRPATGVTMDRTKPVQEGVRVKLPGGPPAVFELRVQPLNGTFGPLAVS